MQKHGIKIGFDACPLCLQRAYQAPSQLQSGSYRLEAYTTLHRSDLG